MAGWTCSDNDLNIWDGRIKAKNFIGDGSLLTGITIGTETDPTFQAASNAINVSLSNNSNNISTASAAFYLASAALTNNINLASAAYYIHAASNAIHFSVKGPNGSFQYASGGILASGAIFTDGTNVGIGTVTPHGSLEVFNILSTDHTIIAAGGPISGNFESSDQGRVNRYAFGRDNASTGNFVLTFNEGTPLVTVKSTGNVGIGDSAPGRLLSVSGAVWVNTDCSALTFTDRP